MTLYFGARHEAPNLRFAVIVLVGPHDRPAILVGLRYDGFVRDHDPFSIEADAIMHMIAVALCVPVDVSDRLAVGEGAAGPSAAAQGIEPIFQRRIRKATVIARE